MFNKDNINNFMQQAQKIQEKIQKIKKEISVMEVTGESGAGLVRITINGAYDCKNIEIDPTIISKDNKEMIEDLITAAFNDASRRITEKQKKKMSNISTNIPFPNDINPII